MEHKYISIHSSLAEDSNLETSKLNQLLSMVDVEFYKGDSPTVIPKRIEADVAMFNWSLMMFVPKENPTRILFGDELRGYLEEGVFGVNALLDYEDLDYKQLRTPFTCIGLTDYVEKRVEYGLPRSGQLSGVLVFHRVPEGILPFDRRYGNFVPWRNSD